MSEQLANNSAVALTDDERARLALLEEQVDGGLTALWRIREEGLWRDYGSFALYMAARWGEDSIRRRNQQLAGVRVFGLLREALGEEAVLPEGEYALRPLVTLAAVTPEVAVKVYEEALRMADGAAPTHMQVLEARSSILTTEEQKVETARRQLDASPYLHLKLDAQGGGDPVKLLALSDLLTSCESEVRRQMIILDIHDVTLIRMINEQFVRGNGNVVEIFRSRSLQFADGTAVALANATARQYRQYLDEHWRAHLAEQRAHRQGQAVSVLVFAGDAEGTLESLREVLSAETIADLGRLIMETKS